MSKKHPRMGFDEWAGKLADDIRAQELGAKLEKTVVRADETSPPLTDYSVIELRALAHTLSDKSWLDEYYAPCESKFWYTKTGRFSGEVPSTIKIPCETREKIVQRLALSLARDQDKKIYDALVALGWTPPEKKP